ncbi:MAG: translocation and assembly module TamA [Burkholderiales bacterium]
MRDRFTNINVAGPGGGRPAQHRLPRWCIALILALLLTMTLSVHAQAARKYAVELTGAGTLAPLLNEHLEIRRHENDPEVTPEELRRLVEITPQQIRQLLATEGYFSPAIEASLLEEGGVPVARFNIRLGEPVLVDAVDIRFTGDIANGPHRSEQRMNRLRRQWNLDPGERFRQAAWDGAKNALLKDLLVRDYPAAAIASSEARIDPARRAATLRVEVDSGPLFTFGELQVEGLQRYPRNIVDELNPIRPGDRYSQEKLSELQARLQDSGYFRSAIATAEINPAHPQHVPVRVELTENERRRLGLGVGFSTDAGARLQLRWLDRNFLQRTWRLESEIFVDRETRRIGGSVFLPTFKSGIFAGWHPSVNARVERTDIAGELTDTLRFGARIASPIKTDEQVWGVSYLADRQRVGDVFANNRQAVIGSYIYTRRRLDNLLSPRRGYVASVELDAGVTGVSTSSNLARVLANATWLDTFSRRWQPIVRAQAGQVFLASRLDVPSDLLFRTGGDQTVRGYAFNSLGVPQNGAVVGGRVTAVLSAELVYWITPQWGAAVFTDAGDAADSWHAFSPKHGSGVGGRWRSPIGPVNVDLAYAHETRKPRLHFSIGYGF